MADSDAHGDWVGTTAEWNEPGGDGETWKVSALLKRLLRIHSTAVMGESGPAEVNPSDFSRMPEF